MNKQEFLSRLRKGLSVLPKSEREERLTFYSEMIEDRIEEGLLEEDAVAAVGTVNEIVAQVLDESVPSKELKKENRKKSRAWGITLVVLGSPLWLSLLIAAIAVIISLYAVLWCGIVVSLWSVVVSLWSVFVSFVAGAFGGAVGGIAFICMGNTLTGFAFIAAALVCVGLAILSFYVCKWLTKALARVTVWIAKASAKPFVKKGVRR